MLIKVLRQYFTYNIIGSRTYEVTLDITMKVTDSQPYFLLPVDDYRADLKITDSDGKAMIILSDHEFEEVTGKSMTEIKKLFIKKLNKNTDKKTRDLTKNYRVIAILFNQKENIKEFYEKVKISWIRRTDIDHDGWISKYAGIRIFIPRYGFHQSTSSSIYVSIKTDTKYKILEEPVINNRTKKKLPDVKTILDSIQHKIYRFGETKDPLLIEIFFKVGLPQTVRKWAKLGLFIALTIPSALIGFTLLTNRIAPFSYESLAGVIALLIGERVLIFRDIPLMKRWSYVNLGLAIWCVLILAILMIMGSLLNTIDVIGLINSMVIDQ